MTFVAAISIVSTVLYGCGGKDITTPAASGGGQRTESAVQSGEAVKFTITSFCYVGWAVLKLTILFFPPPRVQMVPPCPTDIPNVTSMSLITF